MEGEIWQAVKPPVGYVVWGRAWSHWAKFFVYSMFGQDTEGNWLYDCEDNPSGFTENIDEADIFAEYIIKWDGCSELHLRDEDGVIHLYGKSSVEEFQELLSELFDLGATYILTFDNEVAQ